MNMTGANVENMKVFMIIYGFICGDFLLNLYDSMTNINYYYYYMDIQQQQGKMYKFWVFIKKNKK